MTYRSYINLPSVLNHFFYKAYVLISKNLLVFGFTPRSNIKDVNQ